MKLQLQPQNFEEGKLSLVQGCQAVQRSSLRKHCAI